MIKYVLLVTICCSFLSGCCYSFKGISIPADVSTFQVENLAVSAGNAPVNIEVTFAEQLRAKIREQSKLRPTQNDPDIVFSGTITSYDITAEAPQEGNTVALNKLTISVLIDFTNNTKPEDDYSKTFSFFETFDATQDLQLIEDDVINRIFDQITENIFNSSFTNW